MPTPHDKSYPVTEKLCSRKDCHLAGIMQPLSNFHKNPAMKCGAMSACKHCANRDKRKWEKRHPEKLQAIYERKRKSGWKERYEKEYRSRPGNFTKAQAARRAWEQRNKPTIRERSLKKRFARFGVTQEWYEYTLAEQGGVCAICGRPPHQNMRLAIDHNHDCCGYIRACDKCRRGLLCGLCNTRLGHLEDRDWNQKATEYLRKYLPK